MALSQIQFRLPKESMWEEGLRKKKKKTKNLGKHSAKLQQSVPGEEELFLGLGSWWPLTIAVVKRLESDLCLLRRAREIHPVCSRVQFFEF